MITLKQYGFECEYEMGVFIRLYFKKDEDVFIETRLEKSENSAVCVCRLCYDGKEITQKAEKVFKPHYDSDLKEKVCKNTVVESFCMASEKICSVPRPWGVMSGIRPTKNIRTLIERGYSDNEVDEILANVYGVSEEKRKLAFSVYENEKIFIDNHDKNSVGLYIGIPFCPTRCSYCSFISSPISISGRYIPDYVSLLVKEIEKTAEVIDRLGLYAESIYIGGGTPTSLSADELEKIFSSVDRYIDKSKIKEITLEAGRPDTITKEKLETALKHGIGRISINPQTMHQGTLDKIGRRHTPDEIVESFHLARNCGFKIINMDLIAGLPDESFEMFKESLDRVCELGSENITVHTMCIKRAADAAKKENDIIHAEHINQMLDYTHKKLDGLGYMPYYMYRQKNIKGNLENVGYAKGDTRSVYNVKIMEEIQHIIALGGGGSSKLIGSGRIERIFNFKDAPDYIRRFDEIIGRKEKTFEILNDICEKERLR